ncbi:MAG: hypothetical protein EHM44_04160 [Ignavibacteriales bacterium]|nr:MAG: hypothetical protein EHM44_04160 [Ignavibacteriales bacterium]
MKNNSSICLFLLIILLAIPTLAQDFEIPNNYKFETKEDFIKYESDILKAIDYLENTSLKENLDKRKSVNAFVMKFLMDSPDLKINIRPFLTDLYDKNTDLLMIFMGGWAKYSINNNYDADEFNGSLFGLKSIIKVYTMGKGVNEDSDVEDLIEMENEGELEEWLKDELED